MSYSSSAARAPALPAESVSLPEPQWSATRSLNQATFPAPSVKNSTAFMSAQVVAATTDNSPPSRTALGAAGAEGDRARRLTRDDSFEEEEGGGGAVGVISLTPGAEEEILKLANQVAQSSVSSQNKIDLIKTATSETEADDVPVAKKSVITLMRVRMQQLHPSLSTTSKAFKIFFIIISAVAVGFSSTALVVLAPGRPLRLTLDLIIIILSVYSCGYLPYRISCDATTPAQLYSGVSHTPFDSWVDFMFLLAFCARFFMAFKGADGNRVSSLSAIVSNYAGWTMLYDFVAALPWGAMTTVPVLDFLKLLRFKYLWASLYPPFFPKAFAVLRAAVAVFGIVHVAAAGCCMVIVIDGNSSDGFLPEMSFAALVEDGGLRYVAGLYWAVNALVNNNYAHPHTKLQFTYSFVASFGGICVGWMIAARVFRYAQLRYRVEHEYDLALQQTALEMQHLRVEPSLQQQIIKYFEHFHQRFGHLPSTASENNHSLLHLLPEFLSSRVEQGCLARNMLRTVPIFMSLRSSTLALIHRKLIPAVCPPQQKIYSRGDLGEEMYFILFGSLAMSNVSGQTTMLGVGQFFGELALLEPDSRSSTVTTLCDVELLVLRRHDFTEIIRHDAEATAKIQSIIAALKLANSAGISSLKIFA